MSMLSREDAQAILKEYWVYTGEEADKLADLTTDVIIPATVYLIVGDVGEAVGRISDLCKYFYALGAQAALQMSPLPRGLDQDTT